MASETHTSPDAAVPAGSTEVAHEGGQGGLPQFRFEYWGGQIVWLLLIFAVLYLLLSRVFVPRLRQVLDTRISTIADALAQARQVQAEAEAQAVAARAELEEGHARARRIAAEAKAHAADQLSKSLAAEDKHLAGDMARAETRIREKRDEAMTHVHDIATETAQVILRQLIGQDVPLTEVEASKPRGAV